MEQRKSLSGFEICFEIASEVVRDALRNMEERKTKLDVLRAHLAEGEKQAQQGEFVENFSMDALIQELDDEIE